MKLQYCTKQWVLINLSDMISRVNQVVLKELCLHRCIKLKSLKIYNFFCREKCEKVLNEQNDNSVDIKIRLLPGEKA